MKLTKMADVVTVIRAGGSVFKTDQGALLSLHDADGKEISAWQNAINAAVTFLRYTPLEQRASDSIIDLASEPDRPPAPTGKLSKFEKLRARVRELADYFALAGKLPPRISLSPEDYTAVLRCVNARIAADARAEARAANEKRIAEKQRGPRIKPVIVPATGLSWRGIPVVEGPTYSKHRPFDFTPLPTTSSLLP